MNCKMKNIAIAMFAALIIVLSTVSVHIALAHNSKFTKMFSNSGNNQETKQDCGNSCTLTSSNTITFGSSGSTTPSPSPTPTSLTLEGQHEGGNDELVGSLETNTGSRVAGATITFTGVDSITRQDIPISEIIGPIDTTTASNGFYQVVLSANMSQELTQNFLTITAHYAGSTAFAASDSINILPPPFA